MRSSFTSYVSHFSKVVTLQHFLLEGYIMFFFFFTVDRFKFGQPELKIRKPPLLADIALAIIGIRNVAKCLVPSFKSFEAFSWIEVDPSFNKP